MIRPIADTGAAWDSLTPEQRRAIGVAAIDLGIAIVASAYLGRGIDHATVELAEQSLNTALDAVIAGIVADAQQPEELPLPSFGEAKEPHCRVCGCTERHACDDGSGGGCHWVEDDLCSDCVRRGVG